MLSKTSFFNRTLFKKNLTRFWPMWGMVTFAGMLLPAALLLNTAHYGILPRELTQLYYQALVYVLPIVSLVYAVLCAVACWEYLFFPRNLSMMHALPLRREGIFLTNFLSGMAMMLIPYLVTGLMCLIVSLLFGAFDLLPLLQTVAGVLGLSFFYFSSATFVAFLTGNIFMLPPLYFLLHFLAPLLDFLTGAYAGQFLFGLSPGYSGKADLFSPTVFLMKHMEITSVTEEVPDLYNPHVMSVNVVDYELHGLWIIGAYALLGLALLGGAWLLYRRRPSECAGDVMAVRRLKPVFRFGIAALAALSGGLLLYMLLWESFRSSSRMTPLPLAVFMIIAGAIGYYAASMMLAKSLRVFRGSQRGMGLVALCSLALCFCLSTDVLGIGTRVPAADNIQQLSFRAADNTYTFRAEDVEASAAEAALLEQVLALHAAIAADSDYILDLTDREGAGGIAVPLDAYGNWDYDQISPYNSVRFIYTLKDGSRMERRYNQLPLTRDRLAQPETYDAMLDTLINSTEMRCKRLLADRPEYEAFSGDIWIDANGGESFSLNDREATLLLEAVRRDAMAGTWGTYDWFRDDHTHRYALTVNLDLRCYQPRGDRYDHENIHIYVRTGMTHTLDVLLQLGIADSEEDLVTYGELDFRNFSRELEAKLGLTPGELTEEELQRYCLELGYDFDLIRQQS